MKRILALLLVFVFMLTGCGQGDTSQKVKLDPKNPVTISIWHYYNSTQMVAFNNMIDEFNETVGSELGIYVEGRNQGNVGQLESSVMASIEKEVGSEEIPNIFASYADTAYAIEKKGYLVDLEEYMTKDEIAEYVDAYIEEGRIGAKGELKIFPTAKSTEIFLINQTDWKVFAKATGATLEQLKTYEGLVEVAAKYYEWTDALTPDVPSDGKAFYGRDAMANLFIVGSMQLGHELFHVENQILTLDIDKDVMRRIWDFYYVSYIKGYFGAYGKFRSDDVTIGELLAFTGSSTSVSYFPEEVRTKEGSYPIEALTLVAPSFADAKPYAVQQGAGMVVTKCTPEEEYASVVFLKWLTDATRNTEFSSMSGYMPVKKEASEKAFLDQTLENKNIDINEKAYNSLCISYETTKKFTLYTNKAFDQGSSARKVLEYHLADRAKADRKAVEAAIAKGMTPEEAMKPYLSDESFESWFADFQAALTEVTK